jgi:uncharacterized membrane protein YbhN (UPF0104 family)
MALAAALGLVLVAGALVVPRLIADVPARRARVAAIPLVGPRIAAIAPMRRPAALAPALALSLASQSAIIVAIVILIVAVAPGTPLLASLRVTPLLVLLMFVPVTPAGVGQREALFVELFGRVGVATDAALAASLALFVAGLGIAALGGLVLLVERSRGARAVNPPT